MSKRVCQDNIDNPVPHKRFKCNPEIVTGHHITTSLRDWSYIWYELTHDVSAQKDILQLIGNPYEDQTQ